jgi:hypothetical protein
MSATHHESIGAREETASTCRVRILVAVHVDPDGKMGYEARGWDDAETQDLQDLLAEDIPIADTIAYAWVEAEVPGPTIPTVEASSVQGAEQASTALPEPGSDEETRVLAAYTSLIVEARNLRVRSSAYPELLRMMDTAGKLIEAVRAEQAESSEFEDEPDDDDGFSSRDSDARGERGFS